MFDLMFDLVVLVLFVNFIVIPGVVVLVTLLQVLRDYWRHITTRHTPLVRINKKLQR